MQELERRKPQSLADQCLGAADFVVGVEAIHQQPTGRGIDMRLRARHELQVLLGGQQHRRIDVLLRTHAELFAADATRRILAHRDGVESPDQRGGARTIVGAVLSDVIDAERCRVRDPTRPIPLEGLEHVEELRRNVRVARRATPGRSPRRKCGTASRAGPCPRGVPAISMYDPVSMFRATNARNGAVTRARHPPLPVGPRPGRAPEPPVGVLQQVAIGVASAATSASTCR